MREIAIDRDSHMICQKEGERMTDTNTRACTHPTDINTHTCVYVFVSIVLFLSLSYIQTEGGDEVRKGGEEENKDIKDRRERGGGGKLINRLYKNEREGMCTRVREGVQIDRKINRQEDSV